jgi:hypothetical protein
MRVTLSKVGIVVTVALAFPHLAIAQDATSEAAAAARSTAISRGIASFEAHEHARDSQVEAHDQALAAEAALHAGGPEWTDLDGNIHASAAAVSAVLTATQWALSKRYRVTAHVTDAWFVSNPTQGGRVLCGSFRTPDHRRHHFIAQIEGSAAEGVTMSAGELTGEEFNISDCRLDSPAIVIGSERPVGEMIRVRKLIQ